MGGESPVKLPLSEDSSLARGAGGADLEKKKGVKATLEVTSAGTGRSSDTSLSIRHGYHTHRQECLQTELYVAQAVELPQITRTAPAEHT